MLIRSEEEHRGALARIEALMDAPSDSEEALELEYLSLVVSHYERELYATQPPDPLTALEFRRKQLGLSHAAFAVEAGIPEEKFKQVLSREIALDLEMVRLFHERWEIPLESLVQRYVLASHDNDDQDNTDIDDINSFSQGTTEGVVDQSENSETDSLLSDLMEALEQAREKEEVPGLGSSIARKISDIHLKSGRLEDALSFAKTSLVMAGSDRPTNLSHIWSLVAIATVYHQLGQLNAASSYFKEAETLQAEFDPARPYLELDDGYRYCDLLLDLGLINEAYQRAVRLVEEAKQRFGDNTVFSLLAKVIIGRAAMQLGDFHEADAALDEAVAILEQNDSTEEMCRALVARAAYFRATENFSDAATDLARVLNTAKQAHLPLLQCDAEIEFGLLAFSTGDIAGAKRHYERASKLSAATEFHRRDQDLSSLNAKLTDFFD